MKGFNERMLAICLFISLCLGALTGLTASGADLVVVPADVAVKTATAKIQMVQVGEAVSQGQPAYFLDTDSKYYRALNDTQAHATVAGIFLTPADADGYAVLMRSGAIDLGVTLSVGVTYVLSANAGGIAPESDLVSDDYITHLGVASATDQLNISINNSLVQVP